MHDGEATAARNGGATRDDDAPRLCSRVAERVRNDILSGAIAAGVRLNEVHLSRALCVSRTPVRAALHALAAEGLLDYERNRGFRVRSYSPDAVADAYEIRASLEGLACRFAAERGLTADDRGAIEDALARGDAVVEAFEGGAAQEARYREANVAFHEAVLGASRNRMLIDMIRLTFARPGAPHRAIVAFSHREVRRRHDDHHRIYEAIRAGDGWRAELLMREHVTSVKSSRLDEIRGAGARRPTGGG